MDIYADNLNKFEAEGAASLLEANQQGYGENDGAVIALTSPILQFLGKTVARRSHWEPM